MANLEQIKKEFFCKLLKHSSRIIQFAFSYIFAHQELMSTIKNDMKKIKALEAAKAKNPGKSECFKQMIQRAYFDYLIKLTKLGFQYVKLNPRVYKEVAPLRLLLEEYEEICAKKVRKPAKPDMKKVCPSDDRIWEQTFKDISALNDRLDAFRHRLDSSSLSSTPSTSCFDPNDQRLKIINEKFEKKLKDIDDGKKKKIRIDPTTEALKKINDRLENLLKDVQDNKRFCDEKKDRPVSVDSDTYSCSSEVLISTEQFSKPQNEKTPRAGPIERHIVIPIEASNSPKISPCYCVKNVSPNGAVQVDLNLNFENGIFVHDKLVDGICIESALPTRNSRK